ncbi:MAG: heavy metal sensor histidine kinase [Pseudomonadota bacterium]
MKNALHQADGGILHRKSIALRLALMFSAVALAGFALIGLAVHELLARELQRHQQEQVHDRLEDLRYMLVRGRATDLVERVQDKIAALTSDGRTRYWLWSDDPEWRYGDDARRIMDLTRTHVGITLLQLAPAQHESALLAADVEATPVHPPLRLVVGVDTAPINQILRGFEIWLLPLILCGALVVAALSYRVARVGLKPVAQLSADAQRIGPDNRGQHLRMPALPLELADLGSSFNSALDRLDAAYAQLESFNADVAHELRTPLANLIGQTQVALARERSSEALHEVLQSNLEELERLRAIVSDMLFLARAERGERATRGLETALAPEIGKTVEFFDMLLDDAGLAVHVEGDARAVIEVALFHRAVTNLLQNAIQHAPRGSRISARVGNTDEGAEVSISNASAYIAPEQLPRLFDRFYRVDASRPNSDANHGLGLAIVKAIATMHGGRVFARSGAGITTVGFTIGRYKAPLSDV